MPRDLSEHQRAALRASKDDKVRVSGRGCKATLEGLCLRDLAVEARLDFSYGSGSGYWAYLTPRGKDVAEALRKEGGV